MEGEGKINVREKVREEDEWVSEKLKQARERASKRVKEQVNE